MKKSDIPFYFSDESSLKSLYNRLLPSFRKIVATSGNQHDTEDLLQDSLVICYKKIQEPGFELTSKLETFIIGIGKRKWLHELRKRKGYSEIMEIEDEGNVIDEMIINDEKKMLYMKHFGMLSESCKKVLELFFKGIKMSEIANTLNFSSEGYARKRKHDCQSHLMDSIKGDLMFKELVNG